MPPPRNRSRSHVQARRRSTHSFTSGASTPALAAALVPGLRARGALLFAQAERTYRVAATTDTADPSAGRRVVALADRRRRTHAAGPGVPVSLVDSGLDFSHPEFAGRADTTALNAQEPATHRRRARHVGRLRHRCAAERRRPGRDLPASGAALVGRREWRRHAARVERDRRRHPRGRPGRPWSHQPEPRLRLARPVDRARRRARRSRWGRSSSQHPGTTATGAARWATRPRSHTSPPSPPPTGRRGRAVLEPVVVRRPRGAGRRHHRRERPRERTGARPPARASPRRSSRAPPRGSGRRGPSSRRARWRRSSAAPRRDIGTPGRDSASGFGMLNVAAALALPAPIRDPYEPNDDVDEADPNGDRYVTQGAVAHDADEALGAHLRQDRPLRGPARRLPGLAPRREHLHGDAHRDRRDGDLALYAATRQERRGPLRHRRPARDRDDEGDGASGSCTGTRSAGAGRTSRSGPERERWTRPTRSGSRARPRSR